MEQACRLLGYLVQHGVLAMPESVQWPGLLELVISEIASVDEAAAEELRQAQKETKAFKVGKPVPAEEMSWRARQVSNALQFFADSYKNLSIEKLKKIYSSRVHLVQGRVDLD